MFGLFYWFLDPVGFMITVLAAALAYGLMVAVIGPRLVASRPTSLAQLSLHMTLTALLIVAGGLGLVYLAAWFLEAQTGAPVGMSLWNMFLLYMGFFAVLGLIQYALSPTLLRWAYRLREPGPSEMIYKRHLEEIAKASGIKTPKLWIAEIDVPNAFAFSSFSGGNVALTRGLIRTMPSEEVKAVIAHEVGHLRHRDVQVLLVLTLVPLALYYLGRSLLFLRYGERRNSGAMIAIAAAMIIAGVVFSFIIRHFNRLREYYADAHSALTLGTQRPLQRALARIHLTTQRLRDRYGLAVDQQLEGSGKMLFIYALTAPLTDWLYEPYTPRRRTSSWGDDIDGVVEYLKAEADKVPAMAEVFASHPPIPKRLRFLDDVYYRRLNI